MTAAEQLDEESLGYVKNASTTRIGLNNDYTLTIDFVKDTEAFGVIQVEYWLKQKEIELILEKLATIINTFGLPNEGDIFQHKEPDGTVKHRTVAKRIFLPNEIRIWLLV